MKFFCPLHKASYAGGFWRCFMTTVKSCNSLANDGLPYVSPTEHFRDSSGEFWRVRYECGNLKFQITDCHGFYVLFVSSSQGMSREKRYSSFDRAYKGLLSFRRKYVQA